MSQVPAPSQIAPHLSGVPTSRGAAGQKCWVPSTLGPQHPIKSQSPGQSHGVPSPAPHAMAEQTEPLRRVCRVLGNGGWGWLSWPPRLGAGGSHEEGLWEGTPEPGRLRQGLGGTSQSSPRPPSPCLPDSAWRGSAPEGMSRGQGWQGPGNQDTGARCWGAPPQPQHCCFWLRSRDGGQIPSKVEVPPTWHPPQPGPAGPAPSRAPTPLRSAAHCPPLGGLAAAPHLHSDSPPPALCRCWGAPFPGQGPGLHRAPEAPRRGRPWFPPSEALAPRGPGWGAHSSSRTLTPCPAHLCLWNMPPAPSRPAARAGHSATRGTLLFFKVHPCFRTWPRSGPVSLGATLPHPKPRAGGLSLPGPPVLGHA